MAGHAWRNRSGGHWWNSRQGGHWWDEGQDRSGGWWHQDQDRSGGHRDSSGGHWDSSAGGSDRPRGSWQSWQDEDNQGWGGHEETSSTSAVADQLPPPSTSAVADQPPTPSGTSAVAVAYGAIVPVDNSHVFTLDYFRSYGPFTVAYRQHNAAFKYFRDVHENQADPFTSPAINFDNHAPTAVAEMDDDPRGMQWG